MSRTTSPTKREQEPLLPSSDASAAVLRDEREEDTASTTATHSSNLGEQHTSINMPATTRPANTNNRNNSLKFGFAIAAGIAGLSAATYATAAISAEINKQDPFAFTEATANLFMINKICATCAQGALSTATYAGITAATATVSGTISGLLHRFCSRRSPAAAATLAQTATARTAEDTTAEPQPSPVSRV